MNWKAIRAVVRKELKETLRDRRTLIIMVVVPVLLYPAMMVLVEQIALFGRRTLEADPVNVTVVGATPADLAYLNADGQLRAVEAAMPPLDGLRDARVDAVVVFPGDEWSGFDTNEIQLFFDGARERSEYARVRVQRRLDALADSLAAARLLAEGLPVTFTRPMAVEETSVASPRDLGAYILGRFLPLLLILMTVLGAFHPSIDLAAGEKERGTLEPLLTVPVPPGHLVLGKFVAASLMGLTAASLNLLSLVFTFQTGLAGLSRIADIRLELPVHSVLLIFAVLPLLAILFSALFIGIAVRSHSFKEAQNSLTPVYTMSLLPAMLPMMPGTVFTEGMALVPVAGVAFLFRELMGGSAPVVPAILAIAATAVYAALALVFASRAFGREDVLFGTGGAVVSAREKRARRRREGAVPAPAAALGVVALAGALFFYGGRIAVMSLGEVGVILTQLLFLAVPALLLIRVGGYSAKETLSLRLPDGRTTAAAALIMAGGIPLGWLVSWLQGFVLEMPLEFLQALRGFVTADSLPRLMWLLLIAAVTPAICEELVFRGVVLRAFGSRMKPWAAIGASALLFGAFHLSNETVIRFLPTAWLGLLVGYTVWHSRSIFTGMLMHVMNNGLVIVLLSVPVLRDRFSDTGNVPPWLLVAVAPVLLGVGLWLLPRRGGGASKAHADVRIMDSVRAGAAVPAAQLPAA